ncbi:hypothetical protein PHJA_002209000 [Phtheirospermum japonicum]|uniref:DUF6821 domain-containing protein n=1 Tax=Phtheirospermum japonicum TaxID=374723 RepID=A0A830CLG1_9LAMI|nr:hypothetical protein PHJA_002209000 [Phtheirospermum japonicum]
MDIVEATADFQDWELLQSSSDSDSAPVSCPDSDESFNEIGSGGLIQANYFSLDAQNRSGEDLDDDKSAGSDNPSWIDPGLEENPNRYLNKESGEFWSDSGSERSEDRIFVELEKNETSGLEIPAEKVNLNVEPEVLGEEENENKKIDESGAQVIDDNRSKNTGELNKRSVVWWKMPVEFLRYCVFRMSPVWAVSVAAAVMGLAILGRRLYKMKKKTRGLEIKVAVDDKKVSQVMSRAARLNEAFSIVKRVPVIRPSLPAVGSTNTWPVMSLR